MNRRSLNSTRFNRRRFKRWMMTGTMPAAMPARKSAFRNVNIDAVLPARSAHPTALVQVREQSTVERRRGRHRHVVDVVFAALAREVAHPAVDASSIALLH